MLTKTLKFDTDVLATLGAMAWGDDGLSAKIATQLDRDLYERVNKALVAMGGKWNRGAKAHLFTEDPRPRVEGLLDSGTLTVKRDGWFPTPRRIVERMIDEAGNLQGLRVLEPSAGNGAIARIAKERGALVNCIELDATRYQTLEAQGYAGVTNADFLECKYFPPFYDRVLMNPPFENGQDVDHVRHAFKFLKPGGRLVAIMSEGPFFRKDRKAIEFREWLDTVGYSDKLPADAFMASDNPTNVQTRIVVIDAAPAP